MNRCLTRSTVCAMVALALAAALSARADKDDKVKQMTPPKDSKEFAMKAAEGGMLEVKLSQLAQQKAQDAQVKQFAQQMVNDHQQANNELMTIAKQKNIDLPNDLKGECKENYEAFQALNGPGFDKAYVLHMVKDHLHDIAAFQEEASAGTDPEIKAWAAKTLPTLRQHAAHLSTVAQAVGIPVDALQGGRSSGNAAGSTSSDRAQPAGARENPNSAGGTGGSSGSGQQK